MKSAYELAMERLAKNAPTVALTAGQKARLADLESLYASKIAEKEIFLKDKISEAYGDGQDETAASLERQLANERKILQAELEERKEAVRSEAAPR